MDKELVIKVGYGDTLRRFCVLFNGSGSLDLDMAGLKAKIFNLFKFSPDVDLRITYIDEDDDCVTIVDDEDLHDAVKQRLNPLRLTVSLASDSARNINRSGSFTPLTSPQSSISRSSYFPPPPCIPHKRPMRVPTMRYMPEPLYPHGPQLSHNPAHRASSSTEAVPNQEQSMSKLVQDLSTKVASAAPEKYRDFISKLSNDMMAKAAAASPAPLLCEVIETLSKLAVTTNDATSKDQRTVPEMPSDVLEKSELSKLNDDLNAPMSHPISEDANRDDHPNNAANVTRSVSTSNSQSVAKDSKTSGIFSGSDGHGKLGSFLPSTSTAPPLQDLGEESVAPKNNVSGHWGFGPIDPRSHASYKMGGIAVPKNNASGQLGGFAPIDSRGHAGQMGGIAVPQKNGLSTGQMGHGVSSPSRGYYPMPLRSRDGNSDSLGRVFHQGVRCDGCGVHPITGPRYKSKVKEDYDLCNVCFAELGNEADYFKMDNPVYYRSPRSIKIHQRKVEGPSQWRSANRSTSNSLKHDSRFMEDVNIVDGTLVSPSTPLTKIWRMHNSGTVAWPRGTQLVWIGGDHLTDVKSFDVELPVEGCLAGNDLNVAIDFTAPASPGQYVSYWRMALPSGQKFGQCVWVLIQVDTPQQEDLKSESVRSLNLNLPPNDSAADSKDQIIDMNVEPVDVEEPAQAKSVEKEAMSVGQVYYNESPISVPTPVPVMSAPVVYPDIDFSSAPFEPTTQVPEAGEVNDRKAVEQSLLKELDSMGFKEVDLNKEVLRVNEYDLDKALDHLCGVSEWDPMLEELQEMGFHDKETCRKLLIKNGGSIKRVVMDLIASEVRDFIASEKA